VVTRRRQVSAEAERYQCARPPGQAAKCIQQIIVEER
jgi:hypothetical protein